MGGASSRTFGSCTLTGGFGDDHSEANDLCSFTAPALTKVRRVTPCQMESLRPAVTRAVSLVEDFAPEKCLKNRGVFPKGMV